MLPSHELQQFLQMQFQELCPLLLLLLCCRWQLLLVLPVKGLALLLMSYCCCYFLQVLPESPAALLDLTLGLQG